MTSRIAGVDLPREKRVEIGLTYVYGIGHSSAVRILNEAGVSLDTRVRDLTDEEVSRIRDVIDRTQTVIFHDKFQINVFYINTVRYSLGITNKGDRPLRTRRNNSIFR